MYQTIYKWQVRFIATLGYRTILKVTCDGYYIGLRSHEEERVAGF